MRIDATQTFQKAMTEYEDRLHCPVCHIEMMSLDMGTPNDRISKRFMCRNVFCRIDKIQITLKNKKQIDDYPNNKA